MHRITIQKEGYTSVDSIVAVRSDRLEALYVPLMEAPARGEEPPHQATAQQRAAKIPSEGEGETSGPEESSERTNEAAASTAEAAPRGALRLTSQPSGGPCR